MTSKTKKLFTICASSLIMAGFTADVTLHTNPTTAQAAKHHKKHATKKKVKESPTAGTTPKSKYSSLGAWYLANDKFLYGRYNGKGYFGDGQDDGYPDWGLYSNGDINPSKANNGYYKEGWIISYVNHGQPTDSELNGINADKYNKAIAVYNSGVNFLKSAKASGSNSSISYDSNSNSWSTND